MTLRRPNLWAGRGRGPFGGAGSGGGHGLGLWTPGGGGPIPIACSYAPPVFPGASSVDLFGDRIGVAEGFIPGATLYPASATIAGGPTLYGTPNNGAHFGVNAGVLGPGIFDARWTWDLGDNPPGVCTQYVAIYGGAGAGVYCSLEHSDDGTTWAVDVPAGSLTGHVAAIVASGHRYWSIHWHDDHSGGYYGGVDLVALCLWGTL